LQYLGNADSVNSLGANKLIKQGAKIAQTAEDILEELAPKLENI
jgi:predicted Rossmann fold nucleotide-binding protein DprA/Smf involved in DNA uptake